MGWLLQSRKRQISIAACGFAKPQAARNFLLYLLRRLFYRLLMDQNRRNSLIPQPLVIGHHLVWTAYGYWLPNDPRGSGSTAIHAPALAPLGEIHYGRKPVQPPGCAIKEFYQEARTVLKYALLSFDAAARDQIGVAFGRVVEEQRYTCWACAVMPDHIHLLIRKHRDTAEEMVEWFKTASRQHLYVTGHRDSDHPTWCGGYNWHFHVDHPDEARRTIGYIERNPLPLRLPQQHWPFVKTYDGWPLHPGHSPNSPYARRLRELGRYP